MEIGFYITIGCLVTSIILGISLARHNLKVLHETKQERIEARRAEKKRKNKKLALMLGIPYDPDRDF